MATDIRSRDDLSFIACTTEGELIHWEPHHEFDTHADAFQYGIDCVDALAQLARENEGEALDAMRNALLSDDWNTDCGEEQGFIDAILHAALDGWRARARGDTVMRDNEVDQGGARWLALNSQLAQREAQIRTLQAARRRASGVDVARTAF